MTSQEITEDRLSAGHERSLIKPLSIFIVSLVVMFLVVTDKSIQEGLVRDFQAFIASSCVFLLNLMGGNASSDGIYLTYKEFTVGVAGGCDGIYVTIMLWAAILSYPGKSGLKLLAIPVAGLSLFLLNLIRCTSLVYILSIDHHLFNVFHNYIWQAVVIVAAISLLIGWIGISDRYSRLPG